MLNIELYLLMDLDQDFDQDLYQDLDLDLGPDLELDNYVFQGHWRNSQWHGSLQSPFNVMSGKDQEPSSCAYNSLICELRKYWNCQKATLLQCHLKFCLISQNTNIALPTIWQKVKTLVLEWEISYFIFSNIGMDSKKKHKGIYHMYNDLNVITPTKKKPVVRLDY